MQGEIEMGTFEGVCRYCGKSKIIMAADQIDADNKISDDCGCYESKKAERWRRVEKNIDILFGAKSILRGFSETNDSEKENIKIAARKVFDGDIKSSSITVSGTTAKISETANGGVRIARELTLKASLEA